MQKVYFLDILINFQDFIVNLYIFGISVQFWVFWHDLFLKICIFLKFLSKNQNLLFFECRPAISRQILTFDSRFIHILNRHKILNILTSFILSILHYFSNFCQKVKFLLFLECRLAISQVKSAFKRQIIHILNQQKILYNLIRTFFRKKIQNPNNSKKCQKSHPFFAKSDQNNWKLEVKTTFSGFYDLDNPKIVIKSSKKRFWKKSNFDLFFDFWPLTRGLGSRPMVQKYDCPT